MNYDYKIKNVDPTSAFIRRVLLYVAILAITISLALIVLFILFERYLGLIVPGALIICALLTLFVMGRRATSFDYTFSGEDLRILGGQVRIDFPMSKISIIKNAEKSDFFNKNIIKFSFINNRIVLKNALNENTHSVNNYLISVENVTYIIALDDYALAIVKGAEND